MSELQPAPNGYPIKLVRDQTPETINPSGEPGELFYGPAGEDHGRWLRLKLAEEVAEYLVDPAADELADVLAAIDALAESHGQSLSELLEHNRRDRRGGFHRGVMMYGRHPEFDASPSPAQPVPDSGERDG